MSAPGDHSSSRSADLTISFTFAVGGALAGVAGILWMIYPGSMRFDTGFQTGLIAFTAAVLGGIGNLKGAVAGSMVISLIQALQRGPVDQITWQQLDAVDRVQHPDPNPGVPTRGTLRGTHAGRPMT